MISNKQISSLIIIEIYSCLIIFMYYRCKILILMLETCWTTKLDVIRCLVELKTWKNQSKECPKFSRITTGFKTIKLINVADLFEWLFFLSCIFFKHQQQSAGRKFTESSKYIVYYMPPVKESIPVCKFRFLSKWIRKKVILLYFSEYF